ncbi:MAG: GNAT family protein [Phycisphaerales bacterium]|jgi:RimJ/RimL family protein N-acetyltransferase
MSDPAAPATFPERLESDVVILRRRTPEDAAALFEVTPPDTFRYFTSGPAAWTFDAFSHWLSHGFAAKGYCPLLVLDAKSGAVVGSSSYLDLDAGNRSVEIGATWYAAGARGTRINPACKLLMLEYAFGPMFAGRGERVTIKCDGRNERSQRAIAKLGAVREGVLRKHKVVSDGFVRDTVMFSVIREEWPAVEAGLRRRIAGQES